MDSEEDIASALKGLKAPPSPRVTGNQGDTADSASGERSRKRSLRRTRSLSHSQSVRFVENLGQSTTSKEFHHMSNLQFCISIVSGQVDPDRAEPVDGGLRVPERRDRGRGRHHPLGPPARDAQPPRRAAAAAVPPRRCSHVRGGGDIALQPGKQFCDIVY